MHYRWFALALATAALAHGAESASHAKNVSAEVFLNAGVVLDGSSIAPTPAGAWLEKPAEELIYLNGQWNDLLSEIAGLGPVSVLSGNEAIVQLASGSYSPFKGNDAHGMVLDAGIDLRLFPVRWQLGAAILPGQAQAPGFVFFDEAGTQVHRILLTPESDTAAFQALAEKYRAEKPAFTPAEAKPEATVPLTPETTAVLLDGWAALEDTHDFSKLLDEFKVSRTDALRAALGKFTAQVDPKEYTALFQRLLEQEVPLMIFVNNDGCIQISTGVIQEIAASPGLLQLVEKDSRTVIALPKIAEVWHVSKPTENGMAHSLELYDAQGNALAYLFGSRKSGEEAVANWKENLARLAVIGEEKPFVQAAEVAAPAPDKVSSNEAVDVSKLSERTRSQMQAVLVRLQEFDKNGDEKLSAEELPRRMQEALQNADANGDALLEESEILQVAYRQLLAQRADRAADQ